MSISNNSLYSCYVRSDVNQFTYQYTIDNFRERNHNLIKSSVFHAEDSSWTIIIAPIVKNITDGNEYLGLFLNRESGDKPVWTKYSFSLVNFQTNEKINSKSNSCFYSQTNTLAQNRTSSSCANTAAGVATNAHSASSYPSIPRQRTANQWSPLNESILVNPGNPSFEILRFEFSPTSNQLQSSRESTRSPVQLINGKSSGIKSFITRDFLFDSSNNLLQNNKLTISCDILLFTINDPLETLDRFDLHLSQNYSNLLKDGKFSDVKIVVDGSELKAHKAVLSARSPVFNAMFETEMMENRENLIRIEDFSKEVVEELLTFIYAGKVNNLSKVAKELLSAADKYELPQLSQLCEQFLMSDLSVESAPEILVLSHLHKAVKLKSVVVDFIINNRKEVMKTENWNLIRQQSDLMEELFKALSNQFDKYGVYVN